MGDNNEPEDDFDAQLIQWAYAERRAMEEFLQVYREFRKVPTFPTQLEVHNDLKPPLRRNPIEGPISYVNKYLDIHYKLLREDVNRNLRRGLHDFREQLLGAEIQRKIKDIRVYEDVHILRRSDRSLTGFKAKFNVSQMGQIAWQYSKRLIFGSLLCLSSNRFDTFCFATVSGNRDPELLAEGRFELEFLTDSLADEFRYIDPKTRFIMVESLVYFKAYQHVLEALKKLHPGNFPFKTCIIDHNKSNVLDESRTIASKVFDLSFMTGQSQHFRTVCLRNQSQWPTAEQMGFDVYQYEAFKSALLRQFVLIQGPPGTGKTYVGLKIVETLHKNRMVWRNGGNRHRHQMYGNQVSTQPIVIICYTNHALDQFLEGIGNFTRFGNIVRIGNQSKSDLLQKCMLKNVRETARERTDVYPDDVLDRIKATNNDLSRIHKKISRLDVEIRSCRTDLLDLTILEDIKEGLLTRSREPNVLLLNDNDIKANLKLNCSEIVMSWFNSHLLLNETHNWFENQLTYLRKNYSNQLDLAVIKWITTCDYDETEDYKSDAESISDDSENSAQEEADDEEVNRVIQDRDVESDTESECGFKKFIEKTKAMNTIRPDAKALKQISKRVIKQLKYETSDQLSSGDLMDIQEAKHHTDLSQLDYDDRWRLYRLWVRIYVDIKKAWFEELTKRYEKLTAVRKLLTVQKTYHLIKNKQIIGMTTTGAAIHRELLRLIDPKIIVIEEAAEVLESHVVTSLTRNTDHLILIGDHRQLKPNITVYELAAKYKLDVSLFERMIANQMVYRQLKIQYRMRPEMSKLIRPNIYRELHDADVVKSYENVKGMRTNMFFFNHKKPETTNEERMSKLNPFEVHFIVRLAKHLLYQGYTTKQITILTLYSSQLIEIRKLMKEDPIFKIDKPGQRFIATTVDNYQGEENDIILVSFVRSNNEKEIGFLKIPNRVCVALSRAKRGLYCIGNFDCMSESELWGSIIAYLRSIAAIGPTLDLKCENHLKLMPIRELDDFERKSPCGGCTVPSTDRLDCGHPCPLRYCHSSEGHINVACNFLVEKELECGHVVEAICSEDVICYMPCQRFLNCGHTCDKNCGEECQTECTQMCDKVIEECGHTIRLECWQDCGPDHCQELVYKTFDDCQHEIEIECRYLESQTCDVECNVVLICGHQCGGTCHDCSQSRFHVECQENCQKRLICGHNCSGTCGQNCPPCDHPCDNACPHRVCAHTCSQPCFECPEQCLGQRNFTDSVDKNRDYFCLVLANKERQRELHQKAQGVYDYRSRTESISAKFMKLLDSLRRETNMNRRSRQTNQSDLKILSKYEMNIVDNKLIVVENVRQLLKQLVQCKAMIHSRDNHIQTDVIPVLLLRMEKLLVFISEVFLNTDQQIVDTQRELKFFNSFVKVMKYSIENNRDEPNSSLMVALRHWLTTRGSFADEMLDQVREDLSDDLSLEDTDVVLTPNNPMNVMID